MIERVHLESRLGSIFSAEYQERSASDATWVNRLRERDREGESGSLRSTNTERSKGEPDCRMRRAGEDTAQHVKAVA